MGASEDRDRLFLAAYPFATLVTPELQVAAAPLRVAGDGLLEGHLARATGQRLGVTEGALILAIFQGPHGYISAQDYAPEPAVPTWNTVRLEIRGTLSVIEDEAARRATLAAQLQALEGPNAPAVSETLISQLLPGIVVFRLGSLSLRRTFKLGQNKAPATQARLAKALRGRGAEALAALTDGQGDDRDHWPPLP
ncbi:MAG: FMN-binding negative transcriptional regulator [Pseudomonadales bacterium]|nr:FMN-binding negative transcriptional regulator [Pseudomonadales bacterium]